MKENKILNELLDTIYNAQLLITAYLTYNISYNTNYSYGVWSYYCLLYI